MGYFCRAHQLVLRREKEGGLVFNPKNAVSIEVDKQAFRLLELIDGTRRLRDIYNQIKNEIEAVMTQHEFLEVITKLLHQEFLINNSRIEGKNVVQPIDPWFKGTLLSAPEKVHLMVTSKCNLSCKGCFAKHMTGRDLTTDQIKKLIDQLAKMRVFQLAIGGGEPFLCKDIVEIAQYARENKILPNITTNGTLLNETIAAKLKPVIGKLQFSLIAPGRKMNDEYRSKGAWDGFIRGCRIARSNKLKFGVNVLVTRKTLPLLPQLTKFILKQGSTEINILRPKPTGDQNRWFNGNQLREAELLILHSTLAELQQKFSLLNLTIDCSLTHIMNYLPETFCQKHGIFGCTAGKRFLTILANGNVYPCSFLVKDFLFLGNIQKQTFREIWKKATKVSSRLKTDLNNQNQKHKLIECCPVITLATVGKELI